jgi:type I restriction enzyme R subunit
MSRLNENAIEQLAIELLEQQGWKHLYGPDIAPNSDNPQRSSYQEVLLSESLRSAIRRLNPTLPGTAHDDAFKQVERVHAPELIASNQAFHKLLTEGVKVTVRQNGSDRGEIVWLDHPENNEFLAVNQFKQSEQTARPHPFRQRSAAGGH